MLSEHATGDRVLALEPVTGVAEVLAAQDAAMRVHTSERLLRFVVNVLERIRADPRVAFGASPRSGLLLVKAAKALAALEGRDHVLPDDVQELVPAVLAHRLLLAPTAAGVERAEVLADALEQVPAL
jgi:MoxR-like ATPase